MEDKAASGTDRKKPGRKLITQGYHHSPSLRTRVPRPVLDRATAAAKARHMSLSAWCSEALCLVVAAAELCEVPDE